MNKTIKMAAIALLASISSTASAQMWIGGNIAYNHSETGFNEKWGTDLGNSTTDIFQIAPEIGYNLSETFSLAASLGYSHNSGSSNTWSFSPYARWHFAESGKVRFFIDGGLNFATSHLNGTHTDINSYGLSFNPGASYAINERLGLVAHLGDLSYTFSHIDAETGCYSNKIFNIGVTNTLTLGMYFNL